MPIIVVAIDSVAVTTDAATVVFGGHDDHRVHNTGNNSVVTDARYCSRRTAEAAAAATATLNSARQTATAARHRRGRGRRTSAADYDVLVQRDSGQRVLDKSRRRSRRRRRRNDRGGRLVVRQRTETQKKRAQQKRDERRH